MREDGGRLGRDFCHLLQTPLVQESLLSFCRIQQPLLEMVYTLIWILSSLVPCSLLSRGPELTSDGDSGSTSPFQYPHFRGHLSFWDT